MTTSAARQAIPFFSAVWTWDDDAAAYVNRTLEARSPAGTSFAILESASDYLYLGSESRFDLAAFILDVDGVISNLTYEYSITGNAWEQFIPGSTSYLAAEDDPPFSQYNFANDGAEFFTYLSSWASRTFSDSNPHAATPPNETERYWIRISASSITTSPTIRQILMRPYAAYCRATDVANLLQLDADFSATTVPTRDTVEDFIYAAQGLIDYKANESWRISYQTNEYHEFNLAGSMLMKRPALRITKLEIWNGSDWQVKTQGRGQDFFLAPELNMFYWSRFFILPARFQSAGNTSGWLGGGEFLHPVRVSYLYGRTIDTDQEKGPIVFDIARKMAAIDLYQNHDYSVLTISGSDKVSLETKIRAWKDEIDHKIESIISWMII